MAVGVLMSGCVHPLYVPVNQDYDGPKPEVKKCAKSLVFTYTPFQTELGQIPTAAASTYGTGGATAVNMAGIGYQQFMTDNVASWVGLNYGRDSEELTLPTGDTQKDSFNELGIAAGVSYYPPTLYSIAPNFGLDLGYGLRNSEFVATTAGATTTTEVTGNSFSIGARAGFDWFWTPGMSIGASYTAGFTNYSAAELKTTTPTGTTTVEGPSKNWYGTGIVKTTLKVNF